MEPQYYLRSSCKYLAFFLKWVETFRGLEESRIMQFLRKAERV